MSTLPMYVVLKSKYNNKYLRYVHEEGPLQGYLQFTGEEVVSPYTKFQVEWSESDQQLVHLRCCYNNKYWGRSSNASKWILSNSDKPEEDRSKWSCTLFEPVPVSGDDFRFKHVNLGNYAVLMRQPNELTNQCLYAGWESPNQDLCDVCTVIDWESLVILPKYVVFKGDNDNYLNARMIEGHQYLQFQGTDTGSPNVVHEVFTTPDGSIRFKSNHFDKFWRRSPNWIWADTTDTSNNNKDTLFWAVKVDDNVIALRNLGNNNFCKRLTIEGKTSCLNASVSTISKEARLEVFEPVISRSIYNFQYHLMHARIYNEQVVLMGSGGATNSTNDSANLDVKVSYTETKSSSWNASVSLKLGVKTTFTSGVPFIFEGKIEVSAEVSSSYQMGGVQTSSSTFETVYKAIVPPMHKATVRAIGTIATCDVPFSYTQTDTLTDGRRVSYRLDDGMYTGVNTFKVDYEVQLENLDPTKLFVA